MILVFRAKWPALATIETLLLSGVSAWLIWQRALRPEHQETWPLLAALASGVGLVSLLAIDRLLLARRGFAILSLAAAAAWTMIALCLQNETPLLHTLLAPGIVVPPRRMVAAAAGTFALLAHLSPLRKGLADRGFVAWRLRSTEQDIGHGAASGSPRTAIPNPRGRSRFGPSPGRGLRRIAIMAIVVALTFRLGLATRIIDLWREPHASPLRNDTATDHTQEQPASSVAAQANGTSVPLIFDANASFLILTAEDADQLVVVTRPSRRDTYTKIGDSYLAVTGATLPTVSIGSAHFKNLYVYVAQPGALSESRYGPAIAAAASRR